MATTWNPADKAAAVTLSGGNEVATVSSGAGGVRSTNPFGTKNSCECLVNSDLNFAAYGISTAAFNVTTQTGGKFYCVVDAGGGQVIILDFTAGVPVGSPVSGTVAATDRLTYEIDGTTLYVRKNGANLIGNAAAGTGGVTIASGTYYPTAFLDASAGAVSLTLDADSPVYAPSTGYTIIGGGGGGSTYTLTADRGVYSQTGITANFPNLVSKAAYKAAANGTTTATIPAHVSGDLLLAFAYRDGSATAPSLPAGWTSILTQAGTTCSLRVGYKFAASSSETSGTWTSATELELAVYSGVDRIGASASQAGTAASVTYPALAMQLGNSWVAAGAGHRSLNTTLETPPTGMTLRDNRLDATAETAIFDTNGLVTSFTSRSVAVGGTASGWTTATVEIVPKFGGAAGSVSYTLTAAAGTYALAGVASGLRTARKLIAAQGTYGLVGQAAGLKRGLKLVSAPGGYTLAGNAAALVSTRKLTAAQGLYGLTGISASLIYTPAAAAYTLMAGAGIYTLTGRAATLRRALALVAQSEIFLETGNTAPLVAARKATAALGSFPATGVAASLRTARCLTLSPVAYVVAGQAAAFAYSPIVASYFLQAVTGAYSIEGLETGIRLGRRLVVATGGFFTTGRAAGLRTTRKLPASLGLYPVTGGVAAPFVSRHIAGDAAAYGLAGWTAALRADRSVLANAGIYDHAGSDVSFALTLVPDTASPRTTLRSSISIRLLLASSLTIEHRLQSSITGPHRLKGRI